MPKNNAAAAKIHVLKTANQAWALFKVGPQAFEIWASEQPDMPTTSAALFIARFTTSKEAEQVTAILNQMWSGICS